MKKTFVVIKKVVLTLLFIFAISVMIFTIVSVNIVGSDDSNLLGYKPYIVLSDSMQDTFSVGDLEVSKIVDPATLEVGDIITFKSIDPYNYDSVITHKIREITTYNGQPAFITYGTTTDSDDAYPVPFDNVIGEYQFKLPKMGYFFEFLRTVKGYIAIVFIPFMILIIAQCLDFFKLVKQYYREQQMAQREKELELEIQKEQAARMKEELEQLRAKLNEKEQEAV
jgi:signal peptidase I